MAAGAGLYAWLEEDDGNGVSEQTSSSDSSLNPLLTETQVLGLLEIHVFGSSSDSAQECYSQGASNAKYEEGNWTVGLVGTSCQGLQVYAVADQTGHVALVFSIPTVAAPSTVAEATTPTSEFVTGQDTGPPANPAAAPISAPDLVGLIEQYLVDSGAMDPECIRTAIIMVEVISGSIGQGARWSVSAENDITSSLILCARFHSY